MVSLRSMFTLRSMATLPSMATLRSMATLPSMATLRSMASLRSRVLVSVLLLSAVGLIALAAVTYAEQRSFLEGRVNDQAKAAVPAISDALAQSAAGEGSEGERSRVSPGSVPSPDLPPGTYGERRDAAGDVVKRIFITYGQATPAAPKLPRQIPLNRLFSADSVGASDIHYRVYASRDPDNSGVTVVAVPLTEIEQTLGRLLLVEGLVIAAVLIVLGVSAFFLVRLGLRPLDRIEAAAGEIAAGDLSRRVTPTNPNTEIGRLGIALNAMLQRLEQAFAERTESEQRLRQFLADASHELRTPIASIRGYAELFRMGAAKDGESTARAMERIEDESKRMGSLVQDMLTLARLDGAPQRPHEPVDLAKLAADAVEDARARDPDRQVTLTAPDPVVVNADSFQLRQVLANLLSNAISHTPAGTSIEVFAQREGELATLKVRDHGPGLPPGSHQSLFERFWRAEGGRERGRAGAGLGLAIVREIVEAHGGSVEAQDAPAGGAVFTVRLPRPAGAPGSAGTPGSAAAERSAAPHPDGQATSRPAARDST